MHTCIASTVHVHHVSGDEGLREFIELPWDIYRHDPLWVPPLLREMREMLGEKNPLFRAGPHALFLAHRDGRPVGRICAGVNLKYNRLKGSNDGYLCLFESVDDFEVARALFDHASEYLASLGADAIRGPISPTNGDEYRGLLVEGLDSPPMIFQNYNPPYYRSFFERYGFARELDYLAYRYDPDQVRDRSRAVEYAMNRYGYRTEPIDLGRLDRDLSDMRQVTALSMPDEWPDLLLPDMDEVGSMAGKLRWLAVPELIQIARAGSRAIGFSVAIPDYNQVLKHMNGRLFPTGWLTFLLGRRRVDAVRLFIMFVIPEHQGKGVAQALNHATMREGLRLGYRWAEASTVLDSNLAMRRQNTAAGGVHYKSYRVYRKVLRHLG